MKTFNVGDSVYDILLQLHGHVISIDHNEKYPILVRFIGKSPYEERITYNDNGCYQYPMRRLYHSGDIGVYLVSPPEPVKKKVKAYQWVVKQSGIYIVTKDHFREDRVTLVFGKYNELICRIDDSEIEVDE